MSKDYSRRKEQSESICKEYLESFNSFTNNSRKHDMSDAMLMILYYHFTKLKEKKKSKIIVDFEMFRYK